jgi:hypothetical protein
MSIPHVASPQGSMRHPRAFEPNDDVNQIAKEELIFGIRTAVHPFGWKSGTRSARCIFLLAAILMVLTARGLLAINPPVVNSPGTSSAPGSTVSNLTPTFSWSAVSGAARYGLAISKSPYGSANIVYSSTSRTGTSFTLPSGYLVNGELYRWNMTSFDSNGNESGNSNTLYFQTPGAPVGPPTINSPGSASAPGSTVSNLTPTFSWSAVSGAARYGLAISKSPYGSANIVYSSTSRTGTSFTLPSGYLVNGELYRWNMTSFDSSGTESGNSNTLYFQTPGGAVDPPTISSPGSGSEPGPTVANLTPTFNWSAVSGAARYGLAISKSPYGSGNIVYVTTSLMGTSFNLPSGVLVSGTTYRWNMTSFDSSGTESSNSNTLYFQTLVIDQGPSISSISPNPVTGSNSAVTFTLTGNNFVSGSKVQVAFAGNNYTFVNTNTNATYVNSTTLTVPITTQPQTDTWKVRVQNPDGQLSAQINLVVNAPENGNLTLSAVGPNPVTGANTPITFTITGTGFANGAKVQVAYASNGYTFINTNTNATFVSAAQLTVPITTTTQADTWHVRVQNSDGMLSNQVNLVVNAPASSSAPLLSAITPNPITGSSNPITFTLTGSNFVSGAKVKVAYAGNGYTFVNTNTNPTFVASNQLTVPIITSTTADTWRVRVQNPDNQLSGEINFVVNAPGSNPAPIVSSVSPHPITGSTSQRTFTISGANFVTGAIVQAAFRDSNYQFRNTNTAANFDSSSQLTVPITTGTTADTWRLRVQSPSGQTSNEVNLLVVPPTPTSAPAILSYPDPSTNIYTTVPSFVANQASNFTPPSVPTYLTATTQAVEPLHPSRLKSVLSKISGALHGLGTVANLVEASNASNLTDFTKASLGVLLHYLPKDAGTRLAQDALTAASLIKIIEEKNPEIALIRLNILIYGKILPSQIDEFVAADPPDPDYQVVVDAEPVTIPILPSSGNLQLDALSRDCSAKQMDAASFLKAATITYNRYSTAYSANDPLSAGLQLQALLNYLHLYDQALQAAANGTMQINVQLSQSGMVDHGADVATIATLQGNLANGLPQEVTQILGDHGYTATDMEAARQQFLALNPGTLAGTLFGSLADLSLVSFHGTSQTPGEAGNISTRLSVGTGDSVLIGGFIITGSASKKVIIRGIGPSLSQFGISGVLADPTLELHDSTGGVIASNNNWGDTQQGEIQDSGLAPTHDLEAAIAITLAPGPYTAIVAGVSNTSGVGSVEIYDLDSGVGSKLANISTRGLVTTGDNVMIGGTIVVGNMSARMLIRAIGPSLASFGISNTLQDPTLELHDSQGGIIASNDNWVDSADATAISATTLPPTDDRESAILATVPPGQYTAIVRGSGDSTGVALVEAYQLQ